jgi:adenylate kinase family enzyme
MKLVFTWIQGCWKWTQARLLVDRYWYKLLEMWNEFRKIVASWTDLWNKVKEIIESGAQVDADLWKEIMENVLLWQNEEKIIFDWFIRNDWNKKIFDKLIPDYKVVLFELSFEKAKNRLLWRMFDKKTWETFPSWTTHNPKTWELLVKREDDKDEAAILKRISEYQIKTIPILEEQEKEWRIIKLSADDSIENIHKNLVNKLWL